MVDLATSVEYKKSPRGRPLLTEPMNPNRVLMVVYKREFENKRWRQIAKDLAISHQAPFLLHKKWKTWALPNIHENLDYVHFLIRKEEEKREQEKFDGTT
jgi:hypothetical protein